MKRRRKELRMPSRPFCVPFVTVSPRRSLKQAPQAAQLALFWRGLLTFGYCLLWTGSPILSAKKPRHQERASQAPLPGILIIPQNPESVKDASRRYAVRTSKRA